MHIHRVLLGLQQLEEAEISKPQIVVTYKPFPPFAKIMEIAASSSNLNAAHHFPTLAMTMKHQRPLPERKTCFRIFSREALITEGNGFQCSQVKIIKVLFTSLKHCNLFKAYGKLNNLLTRGRAFSMQYQLKNKRKS